ncbi:MAG: FtsQ-type POTRA domain-containing protein [Rickettsiales bacterium]
MAAKKKKSSGKKARSKVLRRARRWRWAMAGGAAGFVVFAGMIGWQIYRGDFINTTGKHIADAYASVTAASGFSVSHVAVEGRERTDKKLLMEAIAVRKGESLLSLSVGAIKDRIEQITTIREARVERRLPNTLHITLVERMPMAVWQYQGALHVIDRDGVELKEENPAHYSHLLVVVGKQAPEKFEELLSVLNKQPELAANVIAAIRVGERRWDLKMKQGTKVMLPEEHPEKAWQYLADLEKSRQILSDNLRQIDLRLDEKAFIRMSPPQNNTNKQKTPASEA